VSRSLSTLQAILVGLVLLVGLGLIAATVYAVGSRKWFWNDSLQVRAGFPAVQGVEIGTKVRIRGMEAGEVAAVEAPLSAEGQVMLRLRIRGNLRHLVRKNATVQIVSVGMLGGKAIEIHPGSETAEPAEDNALLASKPTTELTDLLEQTKSTLDQVVSGKGTIGELANNPQLYHALVDAVGSLKSAAGTIQADAEAMKKLPFVGKYVEDPRGLLDRGTGEYNRKWFPEKKLFEPNHAVLTKQGREELDDLGAWLEGSLRHKNAELIVVAYGDPSGDPESTRKLTQDQSHVVLDYLGDKHNRRLYFFKWRTATSLGMGVKPPLPRQDKKLPTPRVEVLVFVPQS
jgi:phospholipid/cholesterol/gamma-HCH transport system substrate-binding protein